MKNRFFPILTLALTGFSAVSCGTATSGIDRNYQVEPTSILLNYNALNISVGENVSLVPHVSPASAYNAKLNFLSSNEDVITVDEKGNVKAVGAGVANVIVSSADNSEVSTVLPVYSVNKLTPSQLDSPIANMLVYQQEHYPSIPEKVESVEYRHRVDYRNDVVQKDYYSWETTTTSKNEGYIKISGYYKETKVEGGNFEGADYTWLFYTDSDYVTHCYHIAGTTKTKLILQTQSYIGKPRYQAVFDLVKSMFRNGHIVYDNNYDRILFSEELGADYTAFKSLVTKGGSATDMVTYRLEQNNIKRKVDPDEESDLDILANTEYIENYYQQILWNKGVTKVFDVGFTMDYMEGEDHCYRDTQVNYSYAHGDDVTLEYPNEKEFKEVEDIFDL